MTDARVQAAASGAADAAQQAVRSPWLGHVARLGFVMAGLLHLLIAFIALRVAWTSTPQDADQSGAFGLLAQSTAGKVVLWVGAVGVLALAVVELVEAFAQRGRGDAKDEALASGKSVATAAVYVALAFGAISFARGSGRSSSSQSTTLTGRLMEHTGGRALIVVVALVIAGVGIYYCAKGIRRSFHDDLVEHPGTTVEWLAVVGHVAKGAVLVLVAVLVGVAGVQRQPGRASGLDGALRTLREQAFGPYLLTVVALGLAAYGVYAVVRARYADL
ncbi:DUF1206 domain-containing protein [Luteipulveratus halotolerans]|uniref:DUF1206 domain-containing protein n=1 Tax=Luteipulveratus halotolerans TaxID=1631356 RepID=A0A0L6CPC7_9MICO|nr:DUF1206 domain-containing protein [Luteipulveratus halotolerans]KNX39614.1 hypothetical protein VV01_19525 [Luteipulveratus halotolerans]